MSETRLPNIPYEDVPDYVPRTVRDTIQGQSRPLHDYIFSGEKRLILYSDAQCGKTVELKHLAAVLYESPLYTPYLFTLDKYDSSSTLEAQLKYSQRFYTETVPVVLLDGYDELPDTEKKSASKQIHVLADDHPEAVVLLSCRTSYESTTASNGFKPLHLDSLSIASTKDFLVRHSSHPEELFEEIKNKEYFAITSGPFFLKEVSRYYNANGQLPSSKSVLYKSYINNICTENGKRGLWRFDTISFESKALPLLQRLAFCMVLSQEKLVSFDKIQEELHLSQDDAKMLRDCPILTIDEDKKCSFIHNAFKEYLAARAMCRLDKASILGLICYPGTEKLRPAMQNTLVLLLDNIPEGSHTRKLLTDWLISQDPELLVRCGGELLDVQTRQQIFEDILLKYMREGLLLGYSLEEPLMDFCNTRNSVELLCKDADCNDTYSHHMANVLRLLSSARLDLLPKLKRKRLVERVFFLLANNINDKEHGNTFASVLDNPLFQNKESLCRLIDLIDSGDNPYYIHQAIEIAFNIGQCDFYADWILANYKKIHSFYIPGTNINHMVFDNISWKAMLAMNNTGNILHAISSIYEDRDCEEASKENDQLISSLFANLEKIASKEDVSTAVCDMLREIDCHNIGVKLMSGAQKVLDKCGGDALFDIQLTRSIEAFNAFKESQDNKAFLAEMNILACMLEVGPRLIKVLSSDALDQNSLRAFCLWISLYPVSHDIIHSIHVHFNETEPEDEQSKKQKYFDELFIKKKGTALIKALPATDTLHGIRLTVTDSQKKAISAAIKKAVSSIQDSPLMIQHTLSVICTYEPDLGDDELMKLFPYLHHHVEYQPKNYGSDENWGVMIMSSHRFICYLEDHLSDIRFIDNAIEDVVSSNAHIQDDFLETITRFIIIRKRKNLYSKLEALIDRIEWPGNRLTLCVEIGRKINRGFSLILDYIATFELEDQLCFYENVLFPSDKCILDSDEKKEAIQKVEELFQIAVNKEEKEKALKLLVSSGHPSGLDWALDYLEKAPEWIETEYFPSLQEYGYESLDKLERIFSLACEVPYHPHYRTSSFEQSLYALKRIGSSSALARDRIITLMRHKAATTTHNELYYYAKETLNKFYEDTNPVPSFKEAGEMYDNLTHP